MTYMDRTFSARVTAQDSGGGAGRGTRAALVIIIEDEAKLTDAFHAICDCLNVGVERVPTHEHLAPVLRERQPMAVIAEIDAAGQDGCHVLMTVAAHDCDLPVLVITGDDPAMLGAVEAVEELWRLSAVEKWPRLLGVGAVVDFLFRAGRKGGCMRLMSV